MNKKPGQLTAMISSTALDLPEHRQCVKDACLHEGIFPIGMEHLPARDASGIRVSLEMVDHADIYIGIYAWRYGWVPDFDNPEKISITEMERVLVAYHRIDAAEMPDEDANSPTDKIVDRNPCDAIRDEDNDLLRALAAAAPSKILVSSRLTPRVLLNPPGQPITGAKRITLPGLRPADAEQLLRSCGIEGDSTAIQSYLATNCDNHPLVIGILGGLIKNYLPARGNFDAWSADAEGGAKLDLASLDLIQRRNHILRAALDALQSCVLAWRQRILRKPVFVFKISPRT